MNRIYFRLFHRAALLTILLGSAVFSLRAQVPEGALNPTKSPDGSMTAYTLEGDLYIYKEADGSTMRLTSDGSDVILNGRASWVYYEEILGRATNYCALWWSPDSRSIAFYRFDDSDVPIFPIYSAKGHYGTDKLTRYPKAGSANPSVRILVASTEDGSVRELPFEEDSEQYFGTPFWSADSKALFISRMPRLQNELNIYRAEISDLSLDRVYRESSETWIEFPTSMLFDRDGMYFVRSMGSDQWEHIYYLDLRAGIDESKRLKRLDSGVIARGSCRSDAQLWETALLGRDSKGNIYFSSCGESSLRYTIYRLDKNGLATALTPADMNAAGARFDKDFTSFSVTLSNCSTPSYNEKYSLKKKSFVAEGNSKPTVKEGEALSQIIWFTTREGLQIPGAIIYPEGFDPSKKYPVHIEIYGGPGTKYVRDRYRTATGVKQYLHDHGIIHITIDSSVAGHNGRSAVEGVYCDFCTRAVSDFVQWAEYLRSLPYVDSSRIGVEGFSFGGTMTTMLLLRHSDIFCCGIAGGGVYDWNLYDSCYTERFMQTPVLNPEGYKRACTLEYVADFPCDATKVAAGEADLPILMLTHGTGDDNVHFQNTLQLIDSLQKNGKYFELMLYPDGMHGYRGVQAAHDSATASAFWARHLLK